MTSLRIDIAGLAANNPETLREEPHTQIFVSDAAWASQTLAFIPGQWRHSNNYQEEYYAPQFSRSVSSSNGDRHS